MQGFEEGLPPAEAAERMKKFTPPVYSGDADFPPTIPIPVPLAPQTAGAPLTPFTRSPQQNLRNLSNPRRAVGFAKADVDFKPYF